MLFLLFLFWIMLSGNVTVEIILVGAAVSAALTCFTRKLIPEYPKLGNAIWKYFPQLVRYLFYLLEQVIWSNVQVIRLILKPGTQRPQIVWFSLPLKGELTRLTLANSITLTPGTVTVSMGDETICIYALRPNMAQGLKNCGFVEKLSRLEEEQNG